MPKQLCSIFIRQEPYAKLLALSIYVGWVWKTDPAVKEIEEGCPWFTKPLVGSVSPACVWAFFVKFICPIVIGLVLVNALGLLPDKKEGTTPSSSEPNTEQAAPKQTPAEDNSSSESQ